MIFNLVRKDFLLVKKYIMIMIVVAIVAPGLLLKQAQVDSSVLNVLGGVIFFLVLFVIMLLLSSSVSLVDETYKKGCAFLCTTPYGRARIVISKYVFSYIVFIVYCLIYFLEHLMIPQYTIDISFEIVIISLALISVFRCILIPLEYKFGYEKAKYIIMILITGMPFVSSTILGRIDLSRINISRFTNMNIIMKMIFVSFILLINISSIFISCTIFKKKDL